MKVHLLWSVLLLFLYQGKAPKTTMTKTSKTSDTIKTSRSMVAIQDFYDK